MYSRRYALGALIAGAVAPQLGCATSRTEADETLRQAMEGKAVPGMAALVMRDFRVERELVAGVRRMDASTPIERGDVWHLGSDGKAMTATLIAVLVERGVLSWHARLDEMLPDLALAMHADYRDVTLPDLLSHRSGLPENVSDIAVINSFYDDTAPLPQQRTRYIAMALQEAPVVPKRGERSYANTGYIIAGAIAERAAGGSFEELIVANVFRPLEIRSISFNLYGDPGGPAGHVDGRVADQPRDPNPRMWSPAGNMSMSLRDWARFSIEHMTGEHGRGRLLSAETYRFLHTPQGETSAALGWGRQATVTGRRGPALTHSGSDGNWYALITLFPETGNGVLVCANAAESMGGDAATVVALRALNATVAEAAS